MSSVKKRLAVVAMNRDEIIEQVRQAYLSAPLGDFPKIRSIMQSLNITNHSGVTLPEMMSIAKSEDWRALRNQCLREDHVVEKCELDLLLTERNIEIYKLLTSAIKVTHRLNMQYASTGRAMSLDGSTELRGFKYDVSALGSLAQAAGDIFKCWGAVQVFIDKMAVIGSEPSMSQTTKAYLNNISKMSETELEQEIVRLDKLSEMLTDRPTLTKEMIDIQNLRSGN